MDVPPELFPAAGSEESDGLVPEPRAAEGGGGAGGARSDFSGFRWADSMELDRIFQKASSLVCGRPFPEEGGEGDGDGEGEIVEAEEQQRFVIPVGDHDLYGNDFGWGKPIASRNGKGRDFDGKLTISPAAESGGVDLEVCLATEKMAAMEDGVFSICLKEKLSQLSDSDTFSSSSLSSLSSSNASSWRGTQLSRRRWRRSTTGWLLRGVLRRGTVVSSPERSCW